MKIMLAFLATLLLACAEPAPVPSRKGDPAPVPWQCDEIIKKGGQC